MDKKEWIEKTKLNVKNTLDDAESSHDWWHVYRVWQLSKKIAENEEVDMFVVELGALLHDIADSKFYDGDESVGPKKARKFLEGLDEDIVEHVIRIIENISFRNFNQSFSSNELDVVQDADRLDAIGAIGIARAFNYGGYKKRELYNPNIEPKVHLTKEEYKSNKSPTINHFYEKLFKLKDMMNTDTGRRMAEGRHEYMKGFVERFYLEWDGLI